MSRHLLRLQIDLVDHGPHFLHRFEAMLKIAGSKALLSTNPMASTASEALNMALAEAKQWVDGEEER